jgi:hypothetical protein
MLTKLIPLVLLSSLLFTGCGEDPKDDTPPDDTEADADTDADTDTDTDADTDADADTDVPQGRIQTVGYQYSPGRWDYTGKVEGDSIGAVLAIGWTRGGQTWEESHAMQLVDAAEDDSWEAYGVSLPIVFSPDAQVDGKNTFFPGDEDSEAMMTWMFTAHDGSTALDCVVWGAHPEMYDGNDCRPITPNQ